MKTLRKRKLAKAMGVKATFCNHPNGTKTLLLEGSYGGFYILDNSKPMSDKEYVEALKKVKQCCTL